MKKKLIFSIAFCSAFIYLSGQVAIGKASVDGDGILDFVGGTTNGILLPIVETMPTGAAAVNGTFVMDANELTVKMMEDNDWVVLTEEGSIDGITFNNSDEVGDGVIIGDSNSTAVGVLVLEATEMALILPKVEDPASNVKSPRAGMICYDTQTKSLAIFDGNYWNFWK